MPATRGEAVLTPCFFARAAQGSSSFPRGSFSPHAMINILTRLFGSRNERLLKQYAQQVREINALEPAIAALADEELRQKTAGAAHARGQRRVARRRAARSVRRRPRSGQAHAEHAALRCAAHRRHCAAQRQDRRNAHRRGQDARRDAARLPERARRQGRARRHRQRLPGAARRRLDGPHLPLPRA